MQLSTGLHNNLTLQPLAVTFGCKRLSFKTRLHSGYGHFLQTATVMIIPHDTHNFWDFFTHKKQNTITNAYISWKLRTIQNRNTGAIT